MLTVPCRRPSPLVECDKGRIEIIPADDVQAGAWTSLTLRWTLGMPVEPGGGVEIILVPRFPTNRSLPQLTDPTAPGFTTARTSQDTIMSLNVLRLPLLQKPHGATLHIIQLGIGGISIQEGETIEVTYGDTRGGSLGVQAQISAREVAFPIFVSSGQDPKFLERFVSWNRQTDVAALREKSDFNPSMRVVGAKAARFHVVAPMEVQPGAPFGIRYSVLDQWCNAASDYESQVHATSTDNTCSAVACVNIRGSQGTLPDIILQKEGFQRVYLVDPNREIIGVSNPIRVKQDTKQLFWGELHGHSEQSDGNGSPDEHYSYARDVALLDFACVCDHDDTLYDHPQRWEHAIQKVQEYSEEGRFIAILGYEERLASVDRQEAYGDINVYYRNKQARMLEALTVPLAPEAFCASDVILVPHTPLYGPETGMGTHWRFLEDIPASLVPLVEIFSTHGNSEYYDCPRHLLWQAKGQSVLDALNKGFRLGFIGSSDYHEVLTGSLLRIQDTPRTINNRHMQARCGLAAVQADRLTREAIFEALKSRKTFAASGIRAYMDFSVNGHSMGTEFALPQSEPRHCKIAVAGPERIVRAEVIRNGRTLADLADGNWHLESEYTDHEPASRAAYYYARATTERGDFIWSSPVWIASASLGKHT